MNPNYYRQVRTNTDDDASTDAPPRDPIREAIEAERARAFVARHFGVSSGRTARADFLEHLRERMAAALAYRMGGPEPKDDSVERLADASFSEHVAHLLRFRGVKWTNSVDMISRGITTGDVPELLTGAGNRVIRKAFESYSGGLMTVAGRASAKDFRDVKLIQVDAGLALQEVPEGGSFTEGFLQSSAETYPISTFGLTFGVSDRLMSDDDLGAFANLADRLGQMAAEFVSAKLATLLEANANLADGTALFAAGHSNLGSAGALSETTLAELLQKMRAQKGLAGQRISVVPHALVVPAALELTARKLVAVITPGGEAPPLKVVVEPRLASATAFYVLAAPAAGMGLSLSFPAGSEVPYVEFRKRPGFMGLQGKVRLDFGCGVADFRGLAKNAGV